MSLVGPRAQVLLVVAIIGTALAVVYVTHLSRANYAELQVLETTRWQLDEDYSRLLLQQSMLANPHRVLNTATDALGMRLPALSANRVVVP